MATKKLLDSNAIRTCLINETSLRIDHKNEKPRSPTLITCYTVHKNDIRPYINIDQNLAERSTSQKQVGGQCPPTSYATVDRPIYFSIYRLL